MIPAFKEGVKNIRRAMFVSKTEQPLLSAVSRLACLLDTPQDIPVLALSLQRRFFIGFCKGLMDKPWSKLRLREAIHIESKMSSNTS